MKKRIIYTLWLLLVISHAAHAVSLKIVPEKTDLNIVQDTIMERT